MENILFYLIIFFCEFILCYYAKKTKNKVFIFISFLFPIIFIGFRYYVGTDYKNYIIFYNNCKNLSIIDLFQVNWEKGALAILKIVSLFTQDGKYFFIPLAFLSIYPLFKSNKLFGYKYLPLSILIFNLIYLPFFMNGMRQGIAMSFVTYSILLILKKHKKRSIVNLIIAYLFHKSCLLFLPFYLIVFFDKSESNKKTFKYMILSSVLISLIILFFLKDYLLSLGILKYSSYLNSIDVNNISFNYIFTYLPVIILLIAMRYRDSTINTLKSLIISGYIFGIIGTTAKYLNRISLYFTFFEIILIPYMLANIKNKRTRIIITFLYILYIIIYFLYQYYVLGRNEIFPYQSWLFN